MQKPNADQSCGHWEYLTFELTCVRLRVRFRG
jgi:hypothetical protein